MSSESRYAIDWPPAPHPCRRDWHSWDLVLPIQDEAHARCMVCGLTATPEQALANRDWQDRQLAVRAAAPDQREGQRG